MKKISKNISYKEGIHSNTATRKNIHNTPTPEQLKAMANIAEKVFQPLRKAMGGKPIRISSFFRSVRLNAVIGGSRTSQHCKGEAMDIQALGKTTNKELFFYIKNNLDFDQLIWEFGDNENPAWIHVSFKMNRPNRKKVKRAISVNGRSKYPDFF